MTKNRYGLGRDIPADVARAVRQRDGFGCVVCGNAIIDYEHFAPEFKDAKEHNTDGIVLLCVMCHGLKTRGRLSSQSISDAMKSPKALQRGFSFGPFDVGSKHPELILGNVVARNVPVLLQIFGENVFCIREPEAQGGPFRISAFVSDRNGAPMMHIVDNEWRTRTSNWDVRVEGKRITINSNVRDIDLVLRSNPPHQLVFERFNMRHRGIAISSNAGQPTVFEMLDGRTLSTDGMDLDGCKIGVMLDKTGLSIGVGGGAVSIKSMSVGFSQPSDFVPRSNRPSSTASILPFKPRK
ncbi:HNH endonuclease [Nitratireductor rhodophyticola]